MDAHCIYCLAVGIGIAAGLRSFTAPAVVSWAAHLGWLNLRDSPLAFMGSTLAVAILSLLAIGELLGDKWPKTPKRTALGPLLARIVMGGVCAACLFAAANQASLIGALLGGIGGVIGTFGGYEIRKRLVRDLKIKDLAVALCEDLVAIGLAVFLVWQHPNL
jgi:uncharacterized membrane protein